MALLPRIVEQADSALVFDSTEEQQTRLCFQKGGYIVPDLPYFLQQRLVAPLSARRAERAALGEAIVPDEAAGVTSGGLVAVGAHFAVQEVDGVRVRHDRLLLAGDPAVGEAATVVYRDGAGRMEPVG